MLTVTLTMMLFAISPASSVAGPPAFSLDGPDAFGYKFLDSDTTAPGAPTYNWVSIKNVGTRIVGLGDDDVAGPFALGFEFPYYWYAVNSCYVGSNGYIAFGDAATNTVPLNPLPGVRRPNNVIAPLLSDLDCRIGGSPCGSVWRWTNAARDTFIVEYDSIRFWNSGGNNTFQIILSKRDSSITYQYKEQSGMPYGGWGSTRNQTGIENQSGSAGVSYLWGVSPARNMYHPLLAVRFTPHPSATPPRVHDVGVMNALNDRSGSVFARLNRPLTVWANVKNFGNQSEGEYRVFFRVTRSNGVVVFRDSTIARASVPGQVESLACSNAWWPDQSGTFSIKVFTRMLGDVVRVNDTAIVECRGIPAFGPVNLAYDGGTPGSYLQWNGVGGFANRFMPAVYPCSVISIRAYMRAATPTAVWFAIYDDDGPGGTPECVLDSATVVVSAPGWYVVEWPWVPVVIVDGAFYVGVLSTAANEPSFGTDSAPPLSFQGWEYAGAWAPSRYAATGDVCVNAMVCGPVGIFEELEPTPAPIPVRLDVNPNPFGNQTSIRLLSPRGGETAIELYDATGSIVRTLALERGVARLDGRLLADGIYFARVAGTEAPVAKVIVTH